MPTQDPEATRPFADVRDRLDDLASSVRERASSLGTHSLEELLGEARELVRRHPGKTILVALFAGIILGRMLRRD